MDSLRVPEGCGLQRGSIRGRRVTDHEPVFGSDPEIRNRQADANASVSLQRQVRGKGMIDGSRSAIDRYRNSETTILD